MIAFILRRTLQAVVVVLVMSILIFAAIYVLGDPVSILIDPEATEAERQAITHALGLDRPLYEQYLIYMGQVLRGNFGISFTFGVPAMQLIFERMPATVELATFALLMAVVIGLPLGIFAGLRPTSPVSRTIMAGSILGFSLPTFWVGLMLILVFAVVLQVLPPSGRGATVSVLGVPLSFLTLDGLKHLILPATTLALSRIALTTRLARASVREILPLDYIKFARAKGLSERRVVGIHVLKNIMIPIVTVTALELGGIIAFAVVTETVFAWPGMGKLLIDSIAQLDRPVVVAYLMTIVVMLVALNLIVDILYSLLDPRVRLGGRAP